MNHFLRHWLNCSVLAFAMISLLQATSEARDFPTRQVQLVVPFAAGGAVDVAARVVGAKLSAHWGQPVIVENRPGASTTIAVKTVSQGNADGYSLLFTLSDTFAVVPYLASYQSFRPMNDLIPVNLVAKIENAIVINPSLPVGSLPQLVDYARAHPGTLRYGSAGRGSNINLTMEMLKALAKIDIQHVPYRGLAPALTATVSNEVQMTVAGYSARSLIESGRVKPIVIAGGERMPAFATVPTTAEVGYPKVDSSSWLMLAAPAKTPPAVLKEINDALTQVLKDPDMHQQLTERAGHVITNISGKAALDQLDKLSKLGEEEVRISGADKE